LAHIHNVYIEYRTHRETLRKQKPFTFAADW